jgi:hypothetical protein
MRAQTSTPPTNTGFAPSCFPGNPLKHTHHFFVTVPHFCASVGITATHPRHMLRGAGASGARARHDINMHGWALKERLTLTAAIMARSWWPHTATAGVRTRERSTKKSGGNWNRNTKCQTLQLLKPRSARTLFFLTQAYSLKKSTNNQRDISSKHLVLHIARRIAVQTTAATCSSCRLVFLFFRVWRRRCDVS